jgi:hypothetical protein
VASRGRKGRLERAYERFLELPVPVVLTVMWLAGVAFISLCALMFTLGSTCTFPSLGT